MKAGKPRPWLRARGWRVTANVRGAGDADWRKVSVKAACMDRPTSITMVLAPPFGGVTYPCGGRGPRLRVLCPQALPLTIDHTSVKADDAVAP